MPIGDRKLVPGAYSQVLDEDLKDLIRNSPELCATLRKIDDEEEPAQYVTLLANLLFESLTQLKPDQRVEVFNQLIQLLGATKGHEYLLRRKVLPTREILTSVHEGGLGRLEWPLPSTALNQSSLFTGAAGTPGLDHELRAEMQSADRVDILVSFIKFSGLRLLMPAFEDLHKRGVQVRVITTSYMGASDSTAIEWLIGRPNVKLKISYDTEHTRLHAKAYQFYRKNGFSTAYIGSANISRPAITSGLEWTVKITEQDQSNVLKQFRGEFESYWESDIFEECQAQNIGKFRKALTRARRSNNIKSESRFFAEITPRPFQERILEKLGKEREIHNSFYNLIVAATGTGKTVVAALDYSRQCKPYQERPRLLFVAHRIEILRQARDCFRAVLRDQNFGEILGGGELPESNDYLFCTISSLSSRNLIDSTGREYYQFIILDEAHHGEAPTYKPLFENFSPHIRLGLTATPERMDGKSILPDFNHRIAAEIRLPEALEERLLCPFHYFGVSDPISLRDERFWKNGRYSDSAISKIYTGEEIGALQRLDSIFSAIEKYSPIDQTTRSIGFCVSIDHAKFMNQSFKKKGYSSEVLLGETHPQIREELVDKFRKGEIQFLFTVDVLNEGFDLPDINLVLFLRPTQSLTIFLQQLGRGLRHALGKDCLTVIDLVGQHHQKYRIDKKFAALLPRQRMQIDKEVEADFPHLPSGCNIQLERVARKEIIHHIRRTLRNFQELAIESISTQTANLGHAPSFEEFIEEVDIDPLLLLKKRTWSEWKSLALQKDGEMEPDRKHILRASKRLCLRDGPMLLEDFKLLTEETVAEEAGAFNRLSSERKTMLYYLLNNSTGTGGPNPSFEDLRQIVRRNPNGNSDLREIIDWRLKISDIANDRLNLPFTCPLNLHASYSSNEIKAAFGAATLSTSGSTGTGVIHLEESKIYIHLVTFNKSDTDFSPTTRYHDYLLSRWRLHWESQSGTSQSSPTGQNYTHFKDRGYTILFFARLNKKQNGETLPFTFLGPVSSLISAEGNRPIKMIWELQHPVPAELYELSKLGG